MTFAKAGSLQSALNGKSQVAEKEKRRKAIPSSKNIVAL
jgi:hypothetical protein